MASLEMNGKRMLFFKYIMGKHFVPQKAANKCGMNFSQILRSLRDCVHDRNTRYKNNIWGLGWGLGCYDSSVML